MKAQLFLFVFALLASATAQAQSSCSATNDNGDAVCNISCPIGQAAVCSNGTGSNSPSCACEGSADFRSPTSSLPNTSKGIFILAGKPGLKDIASILKMPPAPRNLAMRPFAAMKTSERLEETDVLQAINSKLGSLPDIAVSQNCKTVVVGRHCEVGGSCSRFTRPENPIALPSTPVQDVMHGGFCGISCYPVYGEQCSDVLGKAVAAYPLSVQEPPKVTISPPDWEALPTQILGNRHRYLNCTEVEQSATFSHSETTKVGITVNKSKVLRTSERNTTNINAKVQFKAFDMGGSSSREVTQEVSITDGSQQVNEETINLSQTLPLRVPAMSLVTFEHHWVRRAAPVSYTGTVVLDAPLMPNRAGKSRVVDLLPAAAERTFTFSGTVTSAFTTEGNTKVMQRKLSAADCAGELKDRYTVIAEPFN